MPVRVALGKGSDGWYEDRKWGRHMPQAKRGGRRVAGAATTGKGEVEYHPQLPKANARS